MWQRDDPWHCDWDAYVDRETGEVVWVSREEGGPMSEEEIADALSRVLSDPQRYEFIPPLVHGEHHAVFADWLKTIPRNIRDVCNTVSIGGFHETLEEHFPEEAPVLWGTGRDSTNRRCSIALRHGCGNAA